MVLWWLTSLKGNPEDCLYRRKVEDLPQGVVNWIDAMLSNAKINTKLFSLVRYSNG